MKLVYEFIASFGSWFLIMVVFGMLGIADWNFWPFIIVFAIVFFPLNVISRWVLINKFGIDDGGKRKQGDN